MKKGWKMRKFLSVTIALGLMATAAHANRLQFVGTLKLVATSAACTPDEYPTGAIFKMRFNPPDSASADPRMGLTIFDNNVSGAQNYMLASGFVVGLTYQTVQLTNIFRFGGQGTGPKLRITRTVPATLTATTPSMSMNGNIQDFDGTVDCDISFVAVGVLQ